MKSYQGHNPKQEKYQSSNGDSKFTSQHAHGDLTQRVLEEGLSYVDELVFENGAVYKGYMKNGQRHGPGTQVWPDGAKYEGEWHNN
mmetsp:Transcript_24306/g.18484  ORF Transcript_24306/g.18484 Transcript_24306/m.18484 type:complete len:86 (+) Transcript_24306:102-359(+)